MRWWIAVLGLATLAVCAAPAEASVRVVVRTPRPIWEFTAAGDRIAWIRLGACPRGYSVSRLDLRTGRQARLTSCFAPVNAPPDFVLAGARTMWSQSFGFRHVTVSSVLSASRLGDKQVVATFRARGCGSDGCNQGVSGLKILNGLASGGNRLFYGVLDIAAGTTCANGTCDQIYTGGRVRRLTPRGPVTVPGAPAPAIFAARGRRLADVPLSLGTSSFQLSHSIDVLNAVTGAPIATVTVPDDIVGIALSQSILGVLTLTSGGGYEIWRYTSSGRLLGTTALAPPLRYRGLSATGAKLVFTTKRGIYMLNAVTGVYRRIYLSRHPIVEVAVAHGRAFWSGLWSPAAERTILGMPLPLRP